MPNWNGEERRKNSDERLRGIELQVTRLVAHAESENGNISNAIANIISAQSKHDEKFEKHKEDDNSNFKRIDKTIYLATGILTAVVFIVRIVFK